MSPKASAVSSTPDSAGLIITRVGGSGSGSAAHNSRFNQQQSMEMIQTEKNCLIGRDLIGLLLVTMCEVMTCQSADEADSPAGRD